jgi:threonine dehydratase
MSERAEVEYVGLTEPAFELPPTEAVIKEVTESLRPLREDEAYRQRFYGEMGVVRTELTEGERLHGQQVLYKDERLQPSGSYKSRGASHAVLQLPAERYVTNSTGNHGTSLGIAAARAGAVAVVEGTKKMSSTKVDLVEGTGATLNKVHTTFRDAELAAEAAAREPGTVLVAPFGCPEVVAGQCTLGDELVEDLIANGLADREVVIPVSVAGGGHITGVALPVWEAKQAGRLGPNVHVVAVQPEGTDTMNRALRKVQAGQDPTDLYAYDTQDRDCDALVIGEASLSPLTMAVISNPDFVSGFYAVGKADLGRAMLSLEAELGGNVEPAAALGRAFADKYAAALAESGDQATFVLPVSGGNKSPETHEKYMTAVRQDDFQRLSRAYLHRAGSALDEAIELAGRPDQDAKAIREFAFAALSGFTARHRTGLVEPEHT